MAIAKMLGQSTFDNWLAEQRYANQSQFHSKTVDKHLKATRRAMKVLEKCREDGIVP